MYLGMGLCIGAEISVAAFGNGQKSQRILYFSVPYVPRTRNQKYNALLYSKCEEFLFGSVWVAGKLIIFANDERESF